MDEGSPRDRSRSRSRSPFDEDSRRHQRSPSPIQVDKTDELREDRRGQITAKPSNVIGVFGLHPDTKEPDLEAVFGLHGTITSCTLIYDRYTKSSRGFGFITFESIEDATKAIESCKDLSIMGRPVRVDYSKTNGAHNPTPGKYMGERRDRPYQDRRPYDRYAPRRDRYDDRRGYDRYDDRRGGSGGYDRYDDRRAPSGYDRYDDRRAAPRPSRYEDAPYYGRRDDYARPPPMVMPDSVPAYDRYAPAAPRYAPRSRSPPRYR